MSGAVREDRLARAAAEAATLGAARAELAANAAQCGALAEEQTVPRKHFHTRRHHHTDLDGHRPPPIAPSGIPGMLGPYERTKN